VSFALDDAPPLKIVLAGQEPLRQTLRQSLHADLLNRISVRFHLAPLSKEQTTSYIDFQLKQAGACLLQAAAQNATRISDAMPKYFPRHLPYRLRNEIPLERIIAEHLNWPSKRREENFNAIDFVMLATQRDFVEAVHFLSGLLPPRPSALPAAPAD
jgi:hypothetical protein